MRRRRGRNEQQKKLDEAGKRFEVELWRKEELKEARWGKQKVMEIEDSGEEMEKEPESSNEKVSDTFFCLIIC